MSSPRLDLQSFREALTVLQRQVDDLDELKAQHYQEIMDHEEEVWDVVQGKVCMRINHHTFSRKLNPFLIQVCVVVRSTMDVFDRFTSKA